MISAITTNSEKTVEPKSSPVRKFPEGTITVGIDESVSSVPEKKTLRKARIRTHIRAYFKGIKAQSNIFGITYIEH